VCCLLHLHFDAPSLSCSQRSIDQLQPQIQPTLSGTWHAIHRRRRRETFHSSAIPNSTILRLVDSGRRLVLQGVYLTMTNCLMHEVHRQLLALRTLQKSCSSISNTTMTARPSISLRRHRKWVVRACSTRRTHQKNQQHPWSILQLMSPRKSYFSISNTTTTAKLSISLPQHQKQVVLARLPISTTSTQAALHQTRP
jgi:hypothetical protein